MKWVSPAWLAAHTHDVISDSRMHTMIEHRVRAAPNWVTIGLENGMSIWLWVEKARTRSCLVINGQLVTETHNMRTHAFADIDSKPMIKHWTYLGDSNGICGLFFRWFRCGFAVQFRQPPSTSFRTIAGDSATQSALWLPARAHSHTNTHFLFSLLQHNANGFKKIICLFGSMSLSLLSRLNTERERERASTSKHGTTHVRCDDDCSSKRMDYKFRYT